MSILKKAIDSIAIGLEDYDSSDERRIVSAARNTTKRTMLKIYLMWINIWIILAIKILIARIRNENHSNDP